MPGGETAKKIGDDGEKMMKEFLSLVGWRNLSTNVEYACFSGQKHKISKSDRLNHNVDGIFHYNSPLNHSEADIILCSSKHNQDEYSDSTKAFNHLKDLAQSLECAPRDFEFSNKYDTKGKTKTFKGVLFWVSSNRDEATVSMAEKISTALIKEHEDETISAKLRGLNFDSIYLVDNKKATFIVSAIKTAQLQFAGRKIKFLFPHTGLNNRSEDIMAYGDVMPIQYINTSLLPIVVDDGDKVSVLLFCDSEFSPEYLKRIIWLAHKISGLVGDITLYFNDYDTTTHLEDVNRIKQSFQHSTLADKVKVRKYNFFDFTLLKEEQHQQDLFLNTASQNNEKNVIDVAKEQDLDRILPFGEMIKPIIASTILSDTDLKSFLIRKGIYVGSKEKQNTVPLLSTLLLSPKELNALRFLLKAKEDRIKSVPRKTKLENDIQIKNLAAIIQTSLQQGITDMGLPKNCTVLEAPKVSIENNEIIILFILEKTNTTKDLITGKQNNNGSLIFKVDNGGLEGQVNYTSREVYNYGTKLFKNLESVFITEKIITEEFISIKFNSFDNSTRIDFFLNFMFMDSTSIFSNARLEHILVKPDGSLEDKLPFDLESLKDKVNELTISGKDLDSVHYFQEDYKKALLMQRVKIKYDYSHGIQKGVCLVDLNFKNALNLGDPNSEIHATLSVLKSAGNRGSDIEKLERYLQKEFYSILQKRYQDKFSFSKVNS